MMLERNADSGSINTTGAVILAAGSGSRLGHRPKCLLELDGVPLIQRQIRAISALGPIEIVIVLGHHSHLIAPFLLDQPVTTTYQPSDHHHQSDSVRLGVSKLSPQVRNVLICPSDLPLLTTKDYRAVFNTFQQRPPTVHFVGPEVDGIPGHPVIFDGEIKDQITSGNKTFGSGAWRQAHHAHSLRWRSNNTHFIRDIDSEEDRTRFEFETQRQLRWPKA